MSNRASTEYLSVDPKEEEGEGSYKQMGVAPPKS